MSEEKGPVLTTLARKVLEAKILGAQEPDLQAAQKEHPFLAEPGATFVTLTQNGNLRGCIGTLEAQSSLAEDLSHNAEAAALKDPRFPALSADELPCTRIEVSVLSTPSLLPAQTEEEAWSQVKPGIDGVVLRCPGHRSTFLPQVWEQLPSPKDFFRELKRKAWLSGDDWPAGMEVLTYRVEKFKEALP